MAAMMALAENRIAPARMATMMPARIAMARAPNPKTTRGAARAAPGIASAAAMRLLRAPTRIDQEQLFTGHNGQTPLVVCLAADQSVTGMAGLGE
jgi:hypothetical protein